MIIDFRQFLINLSRIELIDQLFLIFLLLIFDKNQVKKLILLILAESWSSLVTSKKKQFLIKEKIF
jgi:hypothetical protein